MQYRAIHDYQMLEEKVASLKQAISEQNLELLPDYEQRIAVLKELQYIDENSTVLLKGRVACEVCAICPVFKLLLLNPFVDQYRPRARADGAHSRELSLWLRAARSSRSTGQLRLPGAAVGNRTSLNRQAKRGKPVVLG